MKHFTRIILKYQPLPIYSLFRQLTSKVLDTAAMGESFNRGRQDEDVHGEVIFTGAAVSLGNTSTVVATRSAITPNKRK